MPISRNLLSRSQHSQLTSHNSHKSRLKMEHSRVDPPDENMDATEMADVPPASPTSTSGGGIRLMGLNEKAGMAGLDIKTINRTIQEASKGSKFYLHKQAVQDKLDKKVAVIKQQARAYTAAQLQASEKEMTQRAAILEQTRDLSRVVVHLDMDAFFASVEVRDNPALKDVPMAVGGASMLSTSNYAARRYGVRAAMPGFIAQKLCPELVIVPPHFEKYKKASDEVHDVLLEYDPETYMSLDEAQFDLTDYLLQLNFERSDQDVVTPQELVHEIRGKIFEKTQLTASAGIAPNGFLAKICSDINKPNNQFYLDPTLESVQSFLETLPIRKVNGIGAVTEQMLNGLDVKTCGDIWTNRGIINLIFKPATVSFLLRATLGIGSSFTSFGDSSASTTDDRKSMSCERTFSSTSDIQELKKICQKLCKNIVGEMVEKQLLCRGVAVKIKTAAFDVRTRIQSLATHTSDCDIIYETAWKIFESLRKEFEGPELVLRLMGVRLSNFKSISGQGDDGAEGASARAPKQARIDSMLHKFSPDCPCAKCAFRFAPERLYSTSEFILHIFPDNDDLEHDLQPQCPFCQIPITNSAETPGDDEDTDMDQSDPTQLLFAEFHLERCAMNAFEDCDIILEKAPSYRVLVH